MTKKELNYKLINFTALMLLLYIGLSNIGTWWNILITCISVIAPFIIAFAFAYAFNPLVKFLEKKGLKKWLSVTIVVLSVVLIVVCLLSVTLPLIYDQLILFTKTILEIIQDISNKFDINMGNFEIKLTDYFNDAIKSMGAIVSSGASAFISSFVSFAGNFIVGFIAWIYFLVDMDKIRSAVKTFLQNQNKRSYLYLKSIDVELGQYLKGLVIFMGIQLVEYSLLFFLVGHPNWLILGILACITTIIPYFGGLVTNIIAVITATVVSTPVLIGTIIICLIFPQLDGYLISPKVYGKTNNINPLITIMAVSVGGTLAGIVGIIVALPVYLFIRTTYHFFQKDLKKGVKSLKDAI